MADTVHIDGSEGEGGGQMLRSALTCSMLTGRPVELSNIRAGRKKPGLRPQHLTCVKAAAKVCGATVEGGHLGSRDVAFAPGPIRPGTYRFDIGTAGATGLVLQTLALPLARVASRSILTLTGGTHVPFSPAFHFLDRQWAPLLRRMGLDVELELRQAGYYPEGGGEVRAKIRPAARIAPLRVQERGDLERLEGISAVSNLARSIATRQRHQAIERLQAEGLSPGIELADLPSPGKGTMLLLLATFAGGGRACFVGLGARGKRAERVADEACDELLDFLATRGAVDAHTADQLLLPLAVADGPSAFPVPAVTTHLLTNARILERFLPCRLAIDGASGEEGWVRVEREA
jgi:RNA 3'-terminal phosphate cyclase (ATP)